MLKKAFFKVLERQNLKNQTRSELYTNDSRQNILAILRTFSNLKNYFMKNVSPSAQLPKLLLLNFLAKFLKLRKYLMNNLTFVRQKYLYMRL